MALQRRCLTCAQLFAIPASASAPGMQLPEWCPRCRAARTAADPRRVRREARGPLPSRPWLRVTRTERR